MKTLVLLVVTVFLLACSSEPPLDVFQAQVLQGIEAKYEMAGTGVVVNSFHLMHVEGSQYRGVMSITAPGEGTHDMVVTVTRNEDAFMFEVNPQ